MMRHNYSTFQKIKNEYILPTTLITFVIYIKSELKVLI